MKRTVSIIIKRITICLFALFLFFSFNTQSNAKNVTVVIDPGHGGEALGGNYEDRIERDINLITAISMKERLEQYEGVDVYLTRENNTDKELSRKQRFDIAQKVNADFLFSIHYNMSEYHTLYGSEVWVASKGKNYVKGYQFATIEMEALKDLGLFDRGIKNKLDKDRTGEYYGILKYSEEYAIPAVIIEHCHLDEERDSAFWNEQAYKEFGIRDADSVAKYFKLSSTALGIDNSEYERVSVEEPAQRLDMDRTPPEYCDIEITDNESFVTVDIDSFDPDTYIQYYQYSTDGGLTFGRLEAWDDRTSKHQSFDVVKPEGEDIHLIVRTYNQYDQYAQSEESFVEGLKIVDEIHEEPDLTQYETVVINTEGKNNEHEITPLTVFIVVFVVLFITFNIFLVISLTIKLKAAKKKKRKK